MCAILRTRRFRSFTLGYRRLLSMKMSQSRSKTCLSLTILRCVASSQSSISSSRPSSMAKTVMNQLLALLSSPEVEEQVGAPEVETPRAVNLLTLGELAEANRGRQKIQSGIQLHLSMRPASKTQTSMPRRSNSRQSSEEESVRSNLQT